MYRCPEQLDLWSNYAIGPKSDVWALGCVIYYICFQRHPFEDSAKLRIVNANFSLPGDTRYTCFHEIIKGCLQVDPSKRFDVSMILDRLGGISDTKGWPLKGPIKLKVSDIFGNMNDFQGIFDFKTHLIYCYFRENQFKHHQMSLQMQAQCILLKILSQTKVITAILITYQIGRLRHDLCQLIPVVYSDNCLAKKKKRIFKTKI